MITATKRLSILRVPQVSADDSRKRSRRGEGGRDEENHQ